MTFTSHFSEGKYWQTSQGSGKSEITRRTHCTLTERAGYLLHRWLFIVCLFHSEHIKHTNVSGVRWFYRIRTPRAGGTVQTVMMGSGQGLREEIFARSPRERGQKQGMAQPTGHGDWLLHNDAQTLPQRKPLNVEDVQENTPIIAAPLASMKEWKTKKIWHRSQRDWCKTLVGTRHSIWAPLLWITSLSIFDVAHGAWYVLCKIPRVQYTLNERHSKEGEWIGAFHFVLIPHLFFFRTKWR